jgi:hypothetical protein
MKKKSRIEIEREIVSRVKSEMDQLLPSMPRPDGPERMLTTVSNSG